MQKIEIIEQGQYESTGDFHDRVNARLEELEHGRRIVTVNSVGARTRTKAVTEVDAPALKMIQYTAYFVSIVIETFAMRVHK